MRIGLDVGGTKISGVLWNGKVVKKLNYPTNNSQIIFQIKEIIKELEGNNKIEHIGIGVPGTTDGKKIFKAPNVPKLNGATLKKLLRREVKIINDANAFAYAESLVGAAKGKKHVVGLIIGTGIGTGIVINGNIYTGFSGEAGEAGEIFVNQYSNKNWESQFSGPALERLYEETTDNKKSLKIISKEKSSEAKHLMTYENNGVAYFCSLIANILNPEIIVIGGGVSNILDFKKINKEIKKYSHVTPPKIVKNKLGDDAGVIGAALC